MLLQAGPGPRAGPTDDDADARRTSGALYDVDADVQFHPRAGHLTVVPHCPRALTCRRSRARRPARSLDARRLRRAGRRGAACSRRSSAARRSACARVFDRSIPFADNIDAQIFFVARLPRVLAAALVGSGAGAGRRRLSGAAAQPAGLARHARRLGRRGARRDAGDHLPRSTSRCSASRRCRSPASPDRSARWRSSTGCRRRGGAARRRSVLLLGGVTLTALLSAVDRVRAVPGRLHRDVPQRALADGIARRRVATRRSSRRSCRWRSRGPASRRCRACSISSASAPSRRPRAASTSSGPSASRSSARRWPPARPCRSAGRSSFVGIIVPHLVRLIVGADHRLVLPASALFGARVSHRLRSRRAHGHRAARAAGRHRHGHHRRPGFSYGCCSDARDADASSRCRRCAALSRVAARRAVARTAPRRRRAAAADRLARFRRRPRCCSRWAPATAIVGVSNYDRFPPEVDAAAAVGGLLDPNVERILSLKPDLVIVYDTQTELKRQLERAGIADVRLRAPRPARHHRDDARARRADRRAGARRTPRPRASSSSSPPSARRVAGRPRPKTLLVFGREPGALRHVDASGGYGFLHDMLELAGGADVLADVKQQSVEMSTEMILDARARGHHRAALRRRAAGREHRRRERRRLERARRRCRRSGTTASTCSTATSSSSRARASCDATLPSASRADAASGARFR